MKIRKKGSPVKAEAPGVQWLLHIDNCIDSARVVCGNAVAYPIHLLNEIRWKCIYRSMPEHNRHCCCRGASGYIQLKKKNKRKNNNRGYFYHPHSEHYTACEEAPPRASPPGGVGIREVEDRGGDPVDGVCAWRRTTPPGRTSSSCDADHLEACPWRVASAYRRGRTGRGWSRSPARRHLPCIRMPWRRSLADRTGVRRGREV